MISLSIMMLCFFYILNAVKSIQSLNNLQGQYYNELLAAINNFELAQVDSNYTSSLIKKKTLSPSLNCLIIENNFFTLELITFFE